MIAREQIRENRYYWVIARKRTDDTKPTLAYMTGELPCLSMRTLAKPGGSFDTAYAMDYDFLGEADLDELFSATFRGLALHDLMTATAESVG